MAYALPRRTSTAKCIAYLHSSSLQSPGQGPHLNYFFVSFLSAGTATTAATAIPSFHNSVSNLSIQTKNSLRFLPFSQIPAKQNLGFVFSLLSLDIHLKGRRDNQYLGTGERPKQASFSCFCCLDRFCSLFFFFAFSRRQYQANICICCFSGIRLPHGLLASCQLPCIGLLA